MSKLEKMIIPINRIGIKQIDISSESGFVDSFTEDPDNPTGERELMLMYDERLRNDQVAERAGRLDSSPCLKRKYIKIIKNIPYCIYVFYIRPEINLSYNGILKLSAEQKLKILKFWKYPSDLMKSFVGDSTLVVEYSHEMPLADYFPEEYQYGFETKKGGT